MTAVFLPTVSLWMEGKDSSSQVLRRWPSEAGESLTRHETNRRSGALPL